jgi:hypothetical protein
LRLATDGTYLYFTQFNGKIRRTSLSTGATSTVGTFSPGGYTTGYVGGVAVADDGDY